MISHEPRKPDNLKELVEKFIAHPENFTLYRGEGTTNQKGLHFTTDKSWAKSFGGTVIEGRLPAGAKIKVITGEDLEIAYRDGITADNAFHESIFKKGYDAIVGHDDRNLAILDVIINPKLLHLFKSAAN